MNGLTQARAKQIRALRQKKDREALGLFLVEGAKAVAETIRAGWPCRTLLCTESFLEKNPSLPLNSIQEVMLCSEQVLSDTGNFKTNNAAILVAEQKPAFTSPDKQAALWLVLENISDPGNLGTLIRLADWFGLKEISCLGNGVEWYNPKVIAASMGSFLRIRQVAISEKILLSSGRSLLAADMDGNNLYKYQFPARAALLIGNEAAGLSPKWLTAPAERISIPAFGAAESLNAAMAGGILLSHWKQQQVNPAI
jgi:TrmH family RNA methyltransferase